MVSININADLGEGTGNDAALMPMLTSCNIACGGHYGNEQTMRAAIRLAKKHNVKIGAHPSYPDVENFGRKRLKMTKNELKNSIFDQLSFFLAICKDEKVKIHHVKPHGALYNDAVIDNSIAASIIEAIVATETIPILYTPNAGVLQKKAQGVLPVIPEAFIDRRYTATLQLQSRSTDGAVITNPKESWEQLALMLKKGKVNTPKGVKDIIAETYCIHSDSANSVTMLLHINEQLKRFNL